MIKFARLAPALFVLLWATGFIGAGYAMPNAEPFAFLFVRFILAVLLMALLVRYLAGRPATLAEAIHAAIAGAMIHGVYLGGVFWAVYHGMPTGLSALIIGLQPLATTLIAGLMVGERVAARHWVGLAIGFAGASIVLAPRLGQLGGGVDVWTVSACLLAMLSISLGTVWQKRFSGGTDLLTGTLWQYAGAAVLVGAFALAFEEWRFELNGEVIFAMAWLVLVLSVGAVLLLMYLIREGAVARVSSLFFLVPGVTAVLAWLLFGETLTPLQVGGIALAALGVAVATRR